MKTFYALIYIVTIKPIQFLLKNRAVLIICIVAIVGFIAFNSINSNKSDATPEYNIELPDKKLAPDAWVTPSRHYYSVKYSEDLKNIYLEDYFILNLEKWERINPDIPLPLDKSQVKHYTR